MLLDKSQTFALTSSRASPKLATVSWLHFLLRAEEPRGKGVKFSKAYLRGPRPDGGDDLGRFGAPS